MSTDSASASAFPSSGEARHRDLASYVRIYDNALEADFCARMIESFKALSGLHTRNARGQMKQLESSAWTELNLVRTPSASLEKHFHDQAEKYLGLYNDALRLTIDVPKRPRMENLRIKHYAVSEADQFQPHFDSLDYTSNRYMVFLWYLNDIAEGGETTFCDLDLQVSARAGRLLMFPPYWMFQHAGLPPRSNDKFIISTYMLF